MYYRYKCTEKPSFLSIPPSPLDTQNSHYLTSAVQHFNFREQKSKDQLYPPPHPSYK